MRFVHATSQYVGSSFVSAASASAVEAVAVALSSVAAGVDSSGSSFAADSAAAARFRALFDRFLPEVNREPDRLRFRFDGVASTGGVSRFGPFDSDLTVGAGDGVETGSLRAGLAGVDGAAAEAEASIFTVVVAAAAGAGESVAVDSDLTEVLESRLESSAGEAVAEAGAASFDSISGSDFALLLRPPRDFRRLPESSADSAAATAASALFSSLSSSAAARELRVVRPLGFAGSGLGDGEAVPSLTSSSLSFASAASASLPLPSSFAAAAALDDRDLLAFPRLPLAERLRERLPFDPVRDRFLERAAEAEPSSESSFCD